MNGWNLQQLKKKIRMIAGRDLSFKLLQEYIEQSPDRENLILQVAAVLRQPELRSKKTWQELYSKFMSRYRRELHLLFDIQPVQARGGKMGVADTEALIRQITELREQGNILVKNDAQLVDHLFNAFDLKMSKARLRMKIKG